MQTPPQVAAGWVRGALTALSVSGLLAAAALLAGPFCERYSIDLGLLALVPFFLGAAALFAFPVTLVVLAAPPVVFFFAAKLLRERVIWAGLAGLPLAAFSSLFLGSDTVLTIIAKVTHSGLHTSNLAPPFLAGYFVGFAGAYLSSLAIALRYELRFQLAPKAAR